jgi:parallel beta-helix repeat protein
MFATSLAGHMTTANASPRTWTVDDDGVADFRTIQEAVNAASAGDTILVRRGAYNGSVIVNKSISILGEDSASTIVDSGRNGSVFRVTGGGVRISNFTVQNSGSTDYESGIRLEPSVGNVISHNIILNTTVGISLFSSSNNTIVHNSISSSGLHAIYVDSSANNMISNNMISGRSYGISLYSSSNSSVSYNVLSQGIYVGINLYSSKENVVVANTVLMNSIPGLAFYSSNNTFYHNNFINGTNPFFTQSSVNVWHNGVEGNFWSSYEGKDLNGDGIGDTPYSIDEDNSDACPLMGTFSSVDAQSRGIAYQVGVISNSTITDFQFRFGAETGNKIVSFNTIGESGQTCFCRMIIPNELMGRPYIMLVDGDETIPELLNAPNETYSYLYLAYPLNNQTITLISSTAQHLYYELLEDYQKMQADLDALSTLYSSLLNDYLELRADFSSLNVSYAGLLVLQTDLRILNDTYNLLLSNCTWLGTNFQNLSATYLTLLGNYSTLRASFDEMATSYKKHLASYSDQSQNLQNLIYVLAAMTAIFIATTVYLSKQAHKGRVDKAKFEDRGAG